jgi:hypothetical protein
MSGAAGRLVVVTSTRALPAVGDATLDAVGWTGAVGRVPAALPFAPAVAPALAIEDRAAPGAAPFFGEQRVERGRRIHDAAADAAGEGRHGWIRLR